MIDLMQIADASLQIQTVSSDPGVVWRKQSAVAVDAPPDADSSPDPAASWSPAERRTGVCGAVGPRVLRLPSGQYRMYYSQILPRKGFPAGANDYDTASTRILSAASADGQHWTPEPGVRLSPQAAGAGDFRVVSSDVVPTADGRVLRMYFECCPGPQTTTNSIRSAWSQDGLQWTVESGDRIRQNGHNYSAPRIVFLEDGRYRLYVFDRGHGITSFLSRDGLRFDEEAGIRIAQDRPYDSLCAFAPEIFRIQDDGYVMYYAGYSQTDRAQILRAVSDDGLTWRKTPEPVISPGPGGFDAAKASEMCVYPLPGPAGQTVHYGMVYEACDGTAINARGVWRIAQAKSI